MAPVKPKEHVQFVTLDVFTTKSYEGNPLGLVRLPASQKLTQEQKQKIAFEVRLPSGSCQVWTGIDSTLYFDTCLRDNL